MQTNSLWAASWGLLLGQAGGSRHSFILSLAYARLGFAVILDISQRQQLSPTFCALSPLCKKAYTAVYMMKRKDGG